MIGDYGNMTVVLRSLMENEQSKTALDKALSTYPLYVGKKEYDLIPTREALNEKILNHYKYREIGFETVGRFLDELKITMCEIMPYYNELFKSVEIMADLENPFDNVDVTETFEETRTDNATTERTDNASTEGKTTSKGKATSQQETSDNRSNDKTTTGQTTSTGKNKFSDTPQGNISNINNYLTEYREEQNTANSHGSEIDVNRGSSASNSTDNSEATETAEGESTATSHGTSNATGTTRHTFTKKGNQGVNTYAHDMNEFRTSIIDVVDRIIHDKRIAELFMLVW